MIVLKFCAISHHQSQLQSYSPDVGRMWLNMLAVICIRVGKCVILYYN